MDYPLEEIVLLCLFAVLSGAETVTDIALFGRKKLSLLRGFRPFAKGAPAHDHLGDILAVLEPEQFQRCFVAWAAAQTGDPIDFLRRMKFDRVGFHPIEGRALNVVEQINQTRTYAYAVAACGAAEFHRRATRPTVDERWPCATVANTDDARMRGRYLALTTVQQINLQSDAVVGMYPEPSDPRGTTTRSSAWPGSRSMPRLMSAACPDWITGAIGRRRRQRGIQSWLRRMVLGCILPSIAMAAFLVAPSYQRDRAGIEASTISMARALMQAVDQELTGVQSALQVLATSPDIASDNLAEFRDQALAVLPTQAFRSVVLTDATGRRFVDTLRPFGEPLSPHGSPDQLKRVIETGRSVVSDLYSGGSTGRPAVDVAVPIVLQSKATYALAARLSLDLLGELLNCQHLPPGWVARIFDGAGALVARSPDNDQMVGRQASPQLRRSMAEASEGVMNSIRNDGVPVFVSFGRSAWSGWTMVISMPVADLTTEMQHSLWLSVAAACLLLMLMLMLGLIWARSIGSHISGSIAALREPALALASDHHPVLASCDIREVSEVGEALVGASRLLDQRAVERAKAEAEVTDAMRRLTERTAGLERSNSDLEQFAHVASHDLKAPLRAIAHLADWIREDVAATGSPETVENLTLPHARVTRMQMLLDRLLAYARIGRSEFVAETVDTGTMVREIVATLAPPPGFVVTCEGPMPAIRTHRVPLERVPQNLIENGLKHHDRVQGHVTVSAQFDAGMAEFRVSDDGLGIAPEYHDRIFVVFETLLSRDEIEASGIGLAIVKKKIEIHGGRVWIESAPPAWGTTFAFTWKEDVK